MGASVSYYLLHFGVRPKRRLALHSVWADLQILVAVNYLKLEVLAIAPTRALVVVAAWVVVLVGIFKRLKPILASISGGADALLEIIHALLVLVLSSQFSRAVILAGVLALILLIEVQLLQWALSPLGVATS